MKILFLQINGTPNYGNLGVNEVHGGLMGSTEVMNVNVNEIQVDFQGVFVQTIKSCHFYNVILLNCALGSIDEADDGVASG